MTRSLSLNLGLLARSAALAFSLSAGVASVWAQTTEANPTVRAEVGQPISQAQELLRAGKGPESLAALLQAEAVGKLSPYEQYLIARVRAVAALRSNEPGLAVSAFAAALASGLTPAADRPSMLEAQGRAALQARQYAAAVTALRSYAAEGGPDPQVLALLPNALYLAGDYAAAGKEAQDLLDKEAAGGRKPSETLFRLLVSSQVKLGNEVGVSRALERQAVAYPKPEVWAQLISRVLAQPGFPDSLLLDGARLRLATGTLQDEASVLEMAALAMEAGLPSEAKLVLDEAAAKGQLSSPEATKLRERANKAAAKEVAQLAGDLAAAKSAKDGNSLCLVAMALLSQGRADEAARALADGLTRGGVKKPEEARLHWGVALWRAGQGAEARKALESVPAGSSGDLARLWKAWIDSQGR